MAVALGDLIQDGHRQRPRGRQQHLLRPEDDLLAGAGLAGPGHLGQLPGHQVRSSLSYDASVEENTLTAYFTQKMFTASVVLPQTPVRVLQRRLHRRAPERADRPGPHRAGQPAHLHLERRLRPHAHADDDLDPQRRGDAGGAAGQPRRASAAARSRATISSAAGSEIRVTTVGGVDDGVEGLITSGQAGRVLRRRRAADLGPPPVVHGAQPGRQLHRQGQRDHRVRHQRCTPAAGPPPARATRSRSTSSWSRTTAATSYPGVEPEVYYNFELEREGQAHVVMASTSAARRSRCEQDVD